MPAEPENIPWGDERTTDRESATPGNSGNYQQSHSYEHDIGIAALPLASREPKFRIIRLHGGIQTRTVDWSASRSGKPPIIPSAVDTAFDKLMATTITAELPLDDTKGGYNWTVSGSYLYIEAAPRVAGTNAIPTGFYPYPTDPADTLANELQEGVAAAIEEGLTELLSAGPDDPPIAPVDVVNDAIEQTYGASVDQAWPLTFIAPVFSTDAAIET